MISRKLKSFNGHVGYKILGSYSPEEFFIALAIGLLLKSIYTYIYIYIKWTVFVNVTTKSAQHAHARMIAIIIEKSPNSSHMYDHGFMDNTNRFVKWLPP